MNKIYAIQNGSYSYRIYTTLERLQEAVVYYLSEINCTLYSKDNFISLSYDLDECEIKVIYNIYGFEEETVLDILLSENDVFI